MESRLLTSKDNPILKTMRLVAAQARSAPAEIVLAEGLRTLEEATSAGHPIVAVFLSESFGDGAREKALLESWRSRKVKPYRVPAPLFRQISGVITPQGAAALIRVPARRLREMRVGRQPLVLTIDGVQDPGNLGTLLRTAAAARCSMVCCMPGTVSARSPKVIRASAGAFFHVPLVESVSTPDFFHFCRTNRIAIFASSVREGATHTAVDLRKSCAILLGNEGCGVSSDEWRQVCRVRIPMAAGVESLNVAIAGAILLFEARRQRATAPHPRSPE
jgi:TrmH family RNA methyltransferase